MPRIAFTPHLARHLPTPPRRVGGSTVRAALGEVFAAEPRLEGYLLDDQGRLREHLTIFVDGEPVRDRAGLGDPVGEGSEIYVMQALSGG